MKLAFTLFVCICLCFTVTEAQWTKCEGPNGGTVLDFLDTGNSLLSVVVGGFGSNTISLYRSTSNGNDWSKVTSVTEDYYYYLAKIDTTIYYHIWGGFYCSIDDGKNWKNVNQSTLPKQINKTAANDTTVFAGTELGLYRSTNKGKSWEPKATAVPFSNIGALAVNGINVFISSRSKDGQVFRSTDNGENWSEVKIEPTKIEILDILIHQSYIFAKAYGDSVFRSTDNGDTWKKVNFGLENVSVRCFYVYEGKVFMGTSAGLFVSSDNGVTWAQGNNGLKHPVNKMYAKGITLFAGTVGGGIYRSTDKGGKWSEVNSGLRYRNIGSLGTIDDVIFCGTQDYSGPGVSRTSDNGKTWSTVFSSPAKAYVANGEDFFIGLWEVGLLRSSDKGISWIPYDTGKHYTQITSFVVTDTVMFLGNAKYPRTEAEAYRSNDKGRTWVKIKSGLETNEFRGVLAASGNIIYTMTDTEYFRSTNNGKSWVNCGNGLRIQNPLFALDGAVAYKWSNRTFLSRSKNYGLTWDFQFDGIIIEKSLRTASVNAMIVNGSTIYVGTDEDGVFRSTDSGESWTEFGLGENRVNCILLKGTTLYAGTADSGLWKRDVSTLDIDGNHEEMKTSFSEFVYYPNPATNTLTIDRTTLQFPENTPVHYTLSTLVGGKVMEFDNTEPKFTILLDGMVSGVYCLTAENGGNRAAVMVTVAE